MCCRPAGYSNLPAKSPAIFERARRKHHEIGLVSCEPAVALLPFACEDGAAPHPAAALRGHERPQSVPASTCASTGGLGHVALGQATSCFEADAYHGGLVRRFAVLLFGRAAGAAARPPQLEGESQVATLLASRTCTCAPLPRRTRWPPACRPARPSSSTLSASPRGSSAAPSVTAPRHKRRGRAQGARTARPTPCPAALGPWPLPASGRASRATSASGA